MASTDVPAVVPRHDPVPHRRPAARPHPVPHPSAPGVDARAGQLLRGLVFGLPIGLAMWLMLTLLVWRLA